MNRAELERALALTLEDRRLSRGERRALGEVLGEGSLSRDELAFIRSRAFDMARKDIVGHEDRLVVDWLEAVVKVLQRAAAPEEPPKAEACFTPREDGPARIVGLVKETRRSLDVCVFTITDDRISRALHDAHRRGVALRVVSDDDKAGDRGSDVDSLAAAGIPVRMDRSSSHMHHKFAVFDRKLLLTGSYNWTRGAADDNQENFVVLEHPPLVAAFEAEFDDLWKRFAA